MPVGTHYGDTSLKEDVGPFIFQITPEDTPFYNMIGDSEAASPVHQWQIRAINTRQDNAIVEGNAPTFVALQLPTRVTNLTQILDKPIRVSRTQQSSAHHAVSDVYADQLEQAMVGWKTDAEHALLRGSLASGNASNTARRMNGLLNVLSTNATTFASGVTLLEAHLNDLIQNVWNSGGRARDALMNGTIRRRISSFTAGSTKFTDVTDRALVNTVAVYHSDFFDVTMHLSRDMLNVVNGRSIAAVDRDMFKKAWLDTPFHERLAKTADSLDGRVLGELTLEYGNEAAGGLINGAD